jgi:hypothetical protein
VAAAAQYKTVSEEEQGEDFLVRPYSLISTLHSPLSTLCSLLSLLCSLFDLF